MRSLAVATSLAIGFYPIQTTDRLDEQARSTSGAVATHLTEDVLSSPETLQDYFWLLANRQCHDHSLDIVTR
jgi:hypothetical protein